MQRPRAVCAQLDYACADAEMLFGCAFILNMLYDCLITLHGIAPSYSFALDFIPSRYYFSLLLSQVATIFTGLSCSWLPGWFGREF